MPQPSSRDQPDYVVDPADPRAPAQAIWDALSAEQRARVLATLPAEVPIELHPPEGDLHRLAKSRTVDTLDAFFRRIGRKVYVSSELGVYYPDEPRFCPDVLAVLDVEQHDRASWVVSAEGRGLDLVIEVHVLGDKDKDYKLNVARYARLGIREYFIFDRGRLSLRGYRLPSPDEPRSGGRARSYRPLLPQEGRYTSEVLGLDLFIDAGKLRFALGMAALPEAEELVIKLGAMLDQVLVHKDEAEARAIEAELRVQVEAARAEAEAARAEAEAARAEAEAARADALQQKLDVVEARLAELLRQR